MESPADAQEATAGQVAEGAAIVDPTPVTSKPVEREKESSGIRRRVRPSTEEVAMFSEEQEDVDYYSDASDTTYCNGTDTDEDEAEEGPSTQAPETSSKLPAIVPTTGQSKP